LLFLFSGLARAAILLLPFRFLAPLLGQHYKNVSLAALVTEDQRLIAWRIGRITESACKYTPWESKCLVQALIARSLLAWYHIPYVLYLGVCKAGASENQGEELKAHAWLSVGPWIITGREGHKAFTIVSTFVQPSLLKSCEW